jgi:hypothetical protein
LGGESVGLGLESTLGLVGLESTLGRLASLGLGMGLGMESALDWGVVGIRREQFCRRWSVVRIAGRGVEFAVQLLLRGLRAGDLGLGDGAATDAARRLQVRRGPVQSAAAGAAAEIGHPSDTSTTGADAEYGHRSPAIKEAGVSGVRGNAWQGSHRS